MVADLVYNIFVDELYGSCQTLLHRLICKDHLNLILVLKNLNKSEF